MKTLDLVEEFYEDISIVKGFSNETLRHYRYYLDTFKEFCRTKKLYDIEQVTDYQLFEYIKYLNKNFSREMTYKRIVSVRKLYDFLEFKYDITNIGKKMPLPMKLKALPVYCTHEEIEKLINYYNNEDPVSCLHKTIIETFYGLGIRMHELIDLDINRVNLKDCIVKVRGKGDKDRYIPIPSQTAKQIEYYVYNVRSQWNRKKLKNLFVNRLGNPLTEQYVSVMIKVTVRNCNVKKNITAHKIRHTYATHLLEGGADLRVIQELLGHSSINTTEIYTHVDAKRMLTEYQSHHPLARSQLFNKEE